MATSGTGVAAGGLAMLICNGEVMPTLRPEGGAPTLVGTGNEIVHSKWALPPRDSFCKDVSERGHAVEGARADLGGGTETGGAMFESGADVGREGNKDGDVGDEGAGAPGAPVDPKGVIGFMSRWSWVTLGDNRLSLLMPGADNGIGEEGGK